MSKSYKRRNYFIDKHAQSRFMLAFAAASLVASLTAMVIFVYLARNKLEESMYTMRIPKTTVADLLFNEMALTTGLVVAVVLFLFWYTMRRVFAGIDGSLFKMCNVISRMKAGNLRERVAMREGDEFKSFGSSLDEIRMRLHETMVLLRSNSEEISRLAEDGKVSGSSGSNGSCAANIAAMKHELGRLEL